MDRNSPDYYVEPTVTDSVDATHALIAHIRSFPQPRLVEPVLTPRFAISCSDSLLSAIGDIARSDPSLPIQTHMSENRNEVRDTLKLFPAATSYADVYDKHGLLGPRTILAHGIHLEEDEIVLVKERRAGVSHCPTSNFNLRSGVCPVGKLIDRGIKVIKFYPVRLQITECARTRLRSASAQMSRAGSRLPFSPRYSTLRLHRKFCRFRRRLCH
jgi:guanine deaminase